MLRYVLIAGVGLSGCASEAPPPRAPAPKPVAPRAEVKKPSTEVSGWWETDTPCPEGARLKKDDRLVQCVKADGTAHGPMTALREDGARWIEGHYVDGKRDGSWKQWTADGRVSVEGTFRRGEHHGTWTWRWTAQESSATIPVECRHRYESGQVVARQVFKHGKEVRDKDSANALAASHAHAKHGRAFASLTGKPGFSKHRNAYGGLIGKGIGDMKGGWGYGLKGPGPGGGGSGTGWGTIGLGSSKGSGIGSGKGGMRGRKPTPLIRLGKATSTGGLDKNIIRRFVRRSFSHLRYCYERQLQAHPKLKGTVVVKFEIAPTGHTRAVKAEGIGDQKVEHCIERVIQRIQFPRPKGDRAVKVRYPFIFRSSGG